MPAAAGIIGYLAQTGPRVPETVDETAFTYTQGRTLFK